MSLSVKNKTYQWQAGDLITASEAAALLGYKSAKQLQDPERRARVLRDFKAAGCTLTCGIEIGGSFRFLRSEIDEFISATVESARELTKRKNLRLAV